jgi:archaemetzincin
MDAEAEIRLTWIGRGDIDPDLLGRVRCQVERIFDRPTNLRVAHGPPEEALDRKRGQYSSTKILRWIVTTLASGSNKVLGITDVDLFIPVLTYVFGEAQVRGAAAVVSLARLRVTYNQRPAPPPLMEARLLKECLHELGHTFGLVHCSDSACLMSRSNSVLDVDLKGAQFCRDCRQRLWGLMDEEREQS